MTEKTDKVLEEAKGKYKDVVVIGFHENGMPDLTATVLTYPFIHYACNRILFEINNHERSNISPINSAPEGDAPME